MASLRKALLLGMLFLGALGFGFWKWREGLTCRRLLVEGARWVADSSLIRPLVPALGSPLYGAHLAMWERRLVGHPYLRTVRIRPRLPDAWVIQVQERQPVARLAEAPGLYLDDEGRLLPPPERGLPSVPWVRGLGPPYGAGLVRRDTVMRALLPWLRWLAAVGPRRALVAEIALYPGPELVLYTTLGYVPVRVDPERVEEQWKAFEAFYWQEILPRGGRGFEELDVRYRGQVVARLKEGAH
ncbi:MAG: hypothetical protein NZ993_08730 [Bacteroidetes bacterium]|nr:hypothetical protein [Bacteroidota bacterium]